jgi:hypothetical protein
MKGGSLSFGIGPIDVEADESCWTSAFVLWKVTFKSCMLLIANC